MNYFYTFEKAEETITMSGTGENPHDVSDIKWISSDGAKGILDQINQVSSGYSPAHGFISFDNYKTDMYVQIAKFGTIYKSGWRFQNTNLPSAKSADNVAKDETLAKGKTKQPVYVKGSGKRKPYWRMQEVGREEIDPKKVENIWDIPLDQFVRLVSGDKQLLKERYIGEHRYKSYDTHPTLEYLRGLMSERIQHNTNPSLSYFDESIMDIGGISRHEQAVGMALSADEEVPLHVLKDYPELATLYEIDISDSALALTVPVTKYTKLYEMPKDEYDRILDDVKASCDTDPKHVTDAMLKQDYEEELADCKRSAKLRKKLFDKLSRHLKEGYTPDTMDAKLHRSLVEMAHKYNIEIPAETKAGYPTLYTDQPFNYEMTGNAECDAAANDILTQIRDRLEMDDDVRDSVKVSWRVYDIIGASGESVPMMYGAGIETDDDRIIAEGITRTVSSMLISPGLMDQIKSFKPATGRSRVMLTREEGIRAYQSNGVIHLDDYDSSTLAHEYGHAIDSMLPEINELSQAFLNRRTEGEPLVKLADIVPYGHYDDDELTKPDNFMSSYIGKQYDHSASEVLSMGMGYLMSASGMMDMYEQDPEYLGYIVAVLSGRARGAEVTHGPMSGSDEPGAYRPTDKSETIEIDLYKLLHTSGLTRKRVLVRRKGEAPFWSTRWVQEGDTVKDTVEAAGFELVAVEGEEPKSVSLKDLIQSAYEAGKAAFVDGLPNRSGSDPKLEDIIKLNPGGVRDEVAIHEGWAKGWSRAFAAAPVPGVFDEPEDKISPDAIPVYDLMPSAIAAGKRAFLEGQSRSPGGDEQLAAVVRRGDSRDITYQTLSRAWLSGWDEESDKKVEPEPEVKVTLKSLMGKALDAGKAAFAAGILHSEIMSDPKMVDIVGQSDNLMHQLKIRENWSKGWSQAKKAADNFDTMPEVVDLETLKEQARIAGRDAWEGGLKLSEKPGLSEIIERGDGDDRTDRVLSDAWHKGYITARDGKPVTQVYDDDIPEYKHTPTGSMNVSGWGKVGTVVVSELIAGNVQVLEHGKERKVLSIRKGQNDSTVTFGQDGKPNDIVSLDNHIPIPLKSLIDNFDTMPETKQLTAEDVMQPAYDAGADAFNRGVALADGDNDEKLKDILTSISHIPNHEQAYVLRKWIDGWENAQAKAKPKSKSGYAPAGTPLSDRIDPKSRMKVPGIGTTPAITVGNVQIGDRLQFPEGVFRVKAVLVKGASSTMIFEEMDDKGKNLQLKKQNRSWMAVEKTQLHHLGYMPSPNKPGVPHWARAESEFDIPELVSSTFGFTPVKTAAEGISRLQNFMNPDTDTSNLFHKYGIDLDGLKVSSINSIIKGFDKILGKYDDIKLDYIGWNPRKQKAMAYYVTYSDGRAGIEFQKTGTKNVKARQKKSIKNFVINKETNIANHERHLTYPEMRPGDHERTKHSIKLLEACTRWTVDVSLDDMLAGTAAHEASHAVYFKYHLEAAWKRNLTYLVGDKMSRELKCASVSEYGISSVSELFAEVGTAVAFDIPIDPDVKQAYLDTIGSIKQ